MNDKTKPGYADPYLEGKPIDQALSEFVDEKRQALDEFKEADAKDKAKTVVGMAARSAVPVAAIQSVKEVPRHGVIYAKQLWLRLGQRKAERLAREKQFGQESFRETMTRLGVTEDDLRAKVKGLGVTKLASTLAFVFTLTMVCLSPFMNSINPFATAIIGIPACALMYILAWRATWRRWQCRNKQFVGGLRFLQQQGFLSPLLPDDQPAKQGAKLGR